MAIAAQLLKEIKPILSTFTYHTVMVFAGRIYVGGDGFGEKLKDPMVKHLRGRGLEVEDVGTGKYYEVSAAVARAVQVRISVLFGVANDHDCDLIFGLLQQSIPIDFWLNRPQQHDRDIVRQRDFLTRPGFRSLFIDQVNYR